MQTMRKLLVALTVAALASIAAADIKPAAETKTALARPRQSSGKITSINTQAHTLKVDERMFHLTSATRFTKDKKPAAFEEAKTDEEIFILPRESEDQKLNIVTLRIESKLLAAPKKDTPAQ